MDSITHFAIGLTACFLGAIPLGTINLGVIATTVKKGYMQGLMFSLGASFIEIFQAGIALLFGHLIQQFLHRHPIVPVLIASLFLGLGFYFMLRKTNPTLTTNTATGGVLSNFLKGMGVAVVNPQAIPFWLFVLAFLAPYQVLQLTSAMAFYFLTGVFTGKMLALYGFTKLSNYLQYHLTKSCATIDKIAGTVFITLGVIQLFKAF